MPKRVVYAAQIEYLQLLGGRGGEEPDALVGQGAAHRNGEDGEENTEGENAAVGRI